MRTWFFVLKTDLFIKIAPQIRGKDKCGRNSTFWKSIFPSRWPPEISFKISQHRPQARATRKRLEDAENPNFHGACPENLCRWNPHLGRTDFFVQIKSDSWPKTSGKKSSPKMFAEKIGEKWSPKNCTPWAPPTGWRLRWHSHGRQPFSCHSHSHTQKKRIVIPQLIIFFPKDDNLGI